MFDDAGVWSRVLWISGLVMLTYGVILWLASIVWVAGDIQRRTTSSLTQFMAIAFAAVFFIPGLLLYVALRPRETLDERAERRMEVQALAAHAAESPACRSCFRSLRSDFVRCPYCASQVGVDCAGCGRMKELHWVVCPYCGDDGVPPARAGEPIRGARKAQTLAAMSTSRRRNGHAPVR